MATLYVLVGIPGAGKTTWALQHPELVHISSDAIRAELFGREMTLRGYRRIHKIMLQRAISTLEDGWDVALDSSHLSLHSRKRVLNALPDGVSAVAIFIDTTVSQAKKNNRMRTRHVPNIGILLSSRRLSPPSISEGFARVERVVKNFET